MAVPSEFICPITMVTMKDPVLASDGYTYEKEAIQQWLRSNAQSPMTREPMRMDGCRPNRALRDAIERWEKEKEKHTPGKPKAPPRTKGRYSQESSALPITVTPVIASAPAAQTYQENNTLEADHMYAIMIQTQETVEQIKRSSAAPVVQQQQPRRSLTPEERKKMGMVFCVLVIALIIIIFIINKVESNIRG